MKVLTRMVGEALFGGSDIEGDAGDRIDLHQRFQRASILEQDGVRYGPANPYPGPVLPDC